MYIEREEIIMKGAIWGEILARERRVFALLVVGRKVFVDRRPWLVAADGLNIHADRSTARRGFIFMKILKRFAQRFAAVTATEKKF